MGLDPQKCVLFYQSNVSLYPCGISLHYHTGRLDLCCWSVLKVPQHTELMWILSCVASTGYLSRMTQWKVNAIILDDDALAK